MSGKNLSFPVKISCCVRPLRQDINNEKNANKCDSSRRVASSLS